MPTTIQLPADDLDLSFKAFYELMAKRVSEILLVSSPYDAFIMEEDGRLAERIIHEYRGLNLTRPPRLTWVSTASEALGALSQKKFDLVITMPRLDDMDPYALGKEIKKKFQNIPVFLLAHNTPALSVNQKYSDRSSIDKIFVWFGNADLLLFIIKSVEDRMNVAYDTGRAKVPVIIMVEDSPVYCSLVLPLLYKEIVIQTQAVMGESLNEEHRILRMRARPKILVAENYEEALDLYRQFKPYLLSVLSDVRFERNGEMDEEAGFSLLSEIKKEAADIPVLIFSSEEANRDKALKLPAGFVNKNSPSLPTEIRAFFKQHLGFGDFIFRLPSGEEVARVSNIRGLEKILPSIPDESVYYHALRNEFSNWLMARSEIQMASSLRPIKATDFSGPKAIKGYLISCLRQRRKERQKGVVTDFAPDDFDPDTDFVKIGKGSLGGKARGLAFVSDLFKKDPGLQKMFPGVTIWTPRMLVVSTEGFDSFISENELKDLSINGFSDAQISRRFLGACLPDRLLRDLESFLTQVNYPLAVRSSSLLEDAQFLPCAGIYKTYMIPNSHPDPKVRLAQLSQAIKLVYASTFMETPRSFAKNLLYGPEDEKMAVIIQQLTGRRYGDYFYPAVSGVAQSYNFYPISYMKPEEGIAHIALGLGKTVVEGGSALRFSPKYPQVLPQFSTVEEVLKNSQRFFYALKMTEFPENFEDAEDATLARVEIETARDHAPVKFLAGTYIPEDGKIRDAAQSSGHLVMTFAGILKYRSFPLPEILSGLLEMGRKGMGGPVEIEFAINLAESGLQPEFAILQIRPMSLSPQHADVEIDPEEITRSFCFSAKALGNGKFEDMADIVFVRPDGFDPAHTVEIAAEIARINALLVKQNRRYLLVGPGRWGTADRWLGIPVRWHDISGVGAIIETADEKLRAEPSEGTHFFHNITSMGVSYITVSGKGEGFIDWKWLQSLPAEKETGFLRHVRLERPVTLKIDGKTSCAVLLEGL